MIAHSQIELFRDVQCNGIIICMVRTSAGNHIGNFGFSLHIAYPHSYIRVCFIDTGIRVYPNPCFSLQKQICAYLLVNLGWIGASKTMTWIPVESATSNNRLGNRIELQATKDGNVFRKIYDAQPSAKTSSSTDIVSDFGCGKVERNR